MNIKFKFLMFVKVGLFFFINVIFMASVSQAAQSDNYNLTVKKLSQLSAQVSSDLGELNIHLLDLNYSDGVRLGKKIARISE